MNLNQSFLLGMSVCALLTLVFMVLDYEIRTLIKKIKEKDKNNV